MSRTRMTERVAADPLHALKSVTRKNLFDIVKSMGFKEDSIVPISEFDVKRTIGKNYGLFSYKGWAIVVGFDIKEYSPEIKHDPSQVYFYVKKPMNVDSEKVHIGDTYYKSGETYDQDSMHAGIDEFSFKEKIEYIGKQIKQDIDDYSNIKPEYSKKSASLTARLDEVAGELEAVDPRLALAIDRVSDRLEKNAAGKGSFSDRMLTYINMDLDKFLISNKKHERELQTDINDAAFWKILDKAIENGTTEADLFDKLDRCPEWKKLTDPDYVSAKEWQDDIKKLESWVKASF